DDHDTACNPNDSCPAVFNPDQSDLDGDGAGDLCDPCPADPRDTCGAGAAATIGAPGGGLDLGDAGLVVPPLATQSVLSFSVTLGDVSAFGIGSRDVNLVTIATLGPELTGFTPALSVRLRWPDSEPPSGVVDGTKIDEGRLLLFRNGLRTGTCALNSSILCS